MAIWVVAANASRARIFEADAPRGALVEIQDLVHPGSRAKEQGLVSDSAGRGRHHPAGGGPGHSVGHEDDAPAAEWDHFARELARSLDHARAHGRFERLHLFAPPRFLGMLRDHLEERTHAMIASEQHVNVTDEDAGAIRARLSERL